MQLSKLVGIFYFFFFLNWELVIIKNHYETWIMSIITTKHQSDETDFFNKSKKLKWKCVQIFT